MFKRIVVFLAVAFFLLASSQISAQGVLMNSAETINKGNLKLALFPTVLFGKDGSDSVFGVTGRFGYGLSRNIDIEAKAGLFKGLTYIGADIEYWFLKGRTINASAALGAHMTKLSGGGDSNGIDAALLFSTTPAKRLEFYGGLKLAFDSLRNSDYNYTLAHVVPGIEYRISASLDFLAEVGIALNDNSRSYASVGFALYLLR